MFVSQESAARWAHYRWEVSEKRRAENVENERRWRKNRDAFLQSQENLIELLRGKNHRSQEMLNKRDNRRVSNAWRLIFRLDSNQTSSLVATYNIYFNN